MKCHNAFGTIDIILHMEEEIRFEVWFRGEVEAYAQMTRLTLELNYCWQRLIATEKMKRGRSILMCENVSQIIIILRQNHVATSCAICESCELIFSTTLLTSLWTSSRMSLVKQMVGVSSTSMF